MCILSICIPTYNRAALLKKTLDSIVNQKRFIDTDDVEIIISDNCSQDNTEKLSMLYVHRYKNKIFYYKNKSNIDDKNFGKVLTYGRGYYLKLNNDTLTHVNGSLNSIIETIILNKDRKPILFFLNNWVKLPKTIACQDFNSFMIAASGYVTFLGFFGVWKSHFDKYNEIYFNRRAELKLPHVDYLFHLYSYVSESYINNEELFISIQPERKGGYDVLTVFMENYILLLREQEQKGLLSQKILLYERRNILLTTILPWVLNIKFYPKLYYFTSEKAFSRIIKSYKDDTLILIYFFFRYSISFCVYLQIKLMKLILPESTIGLLRKYYNYFNKM